MIVKQIRIESLGNSSYIVGSEQDKTCAIVDPARDVDLYIREARALGLRIAYSLETHVHKTLSLEAASCPPRREQRSAPGPRVGCCSTIAG